MSNAKKGPAPLTRRRFVTLLAAGTAALAAPGGVSAASAPPRKRAASPARDAAASLSPADRKELARQVASTRDTLKVIRDHAMPPGTELALVFLPLKSTRGNG